MMNVITKNGSYQCDEKWCVALATQKIAEIAAGDSEIEDLWAKVVNEDDGFLEYLLWFENGMLQTWCNVTGERDECILFL